MMAFHREIREREDGTRHLLLGLVPGNWERLKAGETIDFEVDGLRVTLSYGRTPKLAGEAMREVRDAGA